jgi:hypothetical protein
MRAIVTRANIRHLLKAETQGPTMGSDGTKGAPADVPTTSDAQEDYGLAPATPAKEKKTAEELAVMIRQDLSNVDGCPKRGVTVTVYGLNPWNSMLTFWRRCRSRPQ